MSNEDQQASTLDDIEAHETAQWLDQQLDWIEHVICEHGRADEEMLEAIGCLRDENGRWATPHVEELGREGLLALPGDEVASH